MSEPVSQSASQPASTPARPRRDELACLVEGQLLPLSITPPLHTADSCPLLERRLVMLIRRISHFALLCFPTRPLVAPNRIQPNPPTSHHRRAPPARRARLTSARRGPFVSPRRPPASATEGRASARRERGIWWATTESESESTSKRNGNCNCDRNRDCKRRFVAAGFPLFLVVTDGAFSWGERGWRLPLYIPPFSQLHPPRAR